MAQVEAVCISKYELSPSSRHLGTIFRIFLCFSFSFILLGAKLLCLLRTCLSLRWKLLDMWQGMDCDVFIFLNGAVVGGGVGMWCTYIINSLTFWGRIRTDS